MSARSSIGAEPIQIVGLVIGYAMRLVIIGLLARLTAATFSRRLAFSQLSKVSPFDPATVVMAALLLAIAVIATFIPPWRASHIEPLTALRND